MRRCPPIVLLGFAAFLISCGPAVNSPATDTETSNFESLPAGSYIGQPPPGDEPQVFAPGFVSTGMAERDFAMTPDLDEIYYTSVLGAWFNFSGIVVTRQVDGAWSRPEVADFSGRYKDLEPAISPDGQQFFFVSTRPLPNSTPLSTQTSATSSSAPGAGTTVWEGSTTTSSFAILTMSGKVPLISAAKSTQKRVRSGPPMFRPMATTSSSCHREPPSMRIWSKET